MDTTLGQNRVRIDFNPSDDDKVGQCKKKTAELIDFLEAERQSGENGQTTPGEKARLIAIAQTAYEEAAMWAVKAVTYK